MSRRIRLAPCLLVPALLASAACGQKPPAPAPRAAHAQPHPPQPDEKAAEEPAPSHDPFEQPEDAPVDLKAIEAEIRHDCCTELPPAEIEKHRER